MKSRISYSILCLLFVAQLGCRDDGIVGEWVGQQFIEGLENEEMPAGGTEFTLKLEKDGSFSARIMVSVMMIMESKIEGTYKLDKDVLTLSGTNEIFIDDGYAKETNTIPFGMQLKVEKDRLSVIDTGEIIVGIVFRRKGTPPLQAPPKVEPAESDTKALELIQQVKKAYSSLRTYSDDVILTSDGAGFRAKNAKIKIRFEQGGKFLLRADHLSGSEVYESEGARFDGQKAFLIMMGGEEERTMGNALSIVQVQSGIASVLIPSLLLGEKMGSSEIDSLESVSLLPDEKVGEATCHVILSSPNPRYIQKFWVDAKSMLILKTHSSAADTTTIHNRSSTSRSRSPTLSSASTPKGIITASHKARPLLGAPKGTITRPA